MDIVFYIDIEGFSATFNQQGKQSMISLSNDIWTLVSKKFEYITAYQFGGDGFLIKTVAPFVNQRIQLTNLAITLLQSVLLRGGIARVQMSQGTMADIHSCYSDEIKKNFQTIVEKFINFNYSAAANHSILTLNPIIGTGIINDFKLKCRQGPLFILDSDIMEQFQNDFCQFPIKRRRLNWELGWLSFSSIEIEDNLKLLGLVKSNLESTLTQYIIQNKLRASWSKNSKSLFYY